MSMIQLINDNFIGVFNSFLSKDECQILIDTLDRHPKKYYTNVPSRIIYNDESIDDSSLTESEFVAFEHSDDELLNNVKLRIHNMVKQYFKIETKVDAATLIKLYPSTIMFKHYDAAITTIDLNNPPEDYEYHNKCPVITALVYLNECDGGELDIEGSKIKTGTGKLVMFYGSKYRHGSEPFNGFRYNISIWFSPIGNKNDSIDK
jgi:hypothetical protein